jgi:hypothetical protein
VVAVALGRLAIQFVEWVLPKIPVLLVSLGQLAIELVAWIARQIPVIALEVGKWAVSLVGWVIESIPGVTLALGEWLLSVLQWLATVPEQLMLAGMKLGQAIGDGIIAGIGDLPQRVGDKLNEIPGMPLVGNAAGFAAGAGANPGGAIIGAAGSALGGLGDLIFRGGKPEAAPTTLNNTTNVYIDGQKISETIDRRLFNNASQASSGFTHGRLGGQ